MQVDDRLRRAGRTARILPEAHVVLARRGCGQLTGPVGEEIRVPVRDGQHGARVTHHEVELVGPRQRRERNRDGADLRGAEERGDELRRVAQDQRDAVAPPDIAIEEATPGQVLHRDDVAVAERLAAVAERRMIAAPGRARRIGQRVREVERG